VPVDAPSRAATIMEDLKILIGEDLRGGRGKGRYFVGSFRGAIGFRRKLRDDYNQVQHAMAGLYIDFSHNRFVQWYVLWQESEPQDDRLYEATFPLGRSLNDSNVGTLPARVHAPSGTNRADESATYHCGSSVCSPGAVGNSCRCFGGQNGQESCYGVCPEDSGTKAIKAGWTAEGQVVLADTDHYFDRIYRFTFVVRDSRMDAGVVFVDMVGRRGVWGLSLLINTQQDFRLVSSAVEIR